MITDSRPDVLLVAFGNPKQEKWIAMHRDRLNVPVCIGVGGTFDFLAGAINRAPAWMQRSGLEWFYRLLQEPRRLWKRYANDLVYFTGSIINQLWSVRGSQGLDSARISDRVLGDCTVVTVEGPLCSELQLQMRGVIDIALSSKTHVVLDLTGMEISNASLLDEATAAAEAMHMFFVSRSREAEQRNANKFFVSDECFPQTIDVLRTRSAPFGIELVIGNYAQAKLDDSYFGAVLQYPAMNGEVHDYKAWVEKRMWKLYDKHC